LIGFGAGSGSGGGALFLLGGMSVALHAFESLSEFFLRQARVRVGLFRNSRQNVFSKSVQGSLGLASAKQLTAKTMTSAAKKFFIFKLL